MLDLATNIVLGGLGFLSVITLVVFVHELGHFLAGRLFGVKIESFSIGFGREILGFTDSYGTRWKIGWLPLGGYVKFWGDEGVASTPDHQKVERISEAERAGSYHHKPLYQKAIVSFAGPAANFVLAISILASLLMIYGDRADAPVIGNVKPGFPAQLAGLLPGDRVENIDGAPIRSFADIVQIVTISDGHPLVFQVRRGAASVQISVTPKMISKPDNFGQPIKDPGVGITQLVSGELESVAANSPADKAGLRATDWIVGVDNATFESSRELASLLSASAGRVITLTVLRANPTPDQPWNRDTLNLKLTPTPVAAATSDADAKLLESAGISVVAKGSPEPYIRLTFGLFDAVSRAVHDTKFIVVKTFYFIGQLLTGRGDYQQLSGPVGIATVSAKVTLQAGVVPLINLAAVLSVSIGLLNLFPIPMLDGGHILYYAIEAVRGRPLGEWAQELGFRIGLAFVVSLLLFATWNDLTKLGLFGLLGFHS
jgi:regulator of sigma E protease